MKSILRLAALCCLAATLRAGTAAPAEPAPIAAPTTINVPTTASELASGYAGAVSQMSLKSLVIYYQAEGKVIPIKGIRSAKAVSAVLLITFSAGDSMALNAEKIVMITDGSRTPQG